MVGDPEIRFYAGAPLKSRVGNHSFGTLCVIDSKPRKGLDEDQMAILEALSRQAVKLMEMHKANRELDRALAEVKELAPP